MKHTNNNNLDLQKVWDNKKIVNMFEDGCTPPHT